jgi:hypothetical protein
VTLSTPIGGWGNALAIALFIVCAASLVLRKRILVSLQRGTSR